LVVTPEKTLLALAEKPRPKPPTIPASNAWLTRLPSRLTTRPRTPDLPAKLMKPLTSLTATLPPG
jgi:hypothetical protein